MLIFQGLTDTKMKNFTWLVFVILLSACQQQQKDKSSQLIGKWKNLSIDVKMNSYKGLAEDSLLQVKPDQWEKILKIKPIITVFNPDGSFTSDYVNPNDSLVFQSTGKWIISGDSLTMIEYEVPNSYLLEFEGDKAKFSAVLDWDEDGVKDDEYNGVQQKIQ